MSLLALDLKLAQRSMHMFKPPVNRAMRVLDRSFFQREEIMAAARVHKLERLQHSLKELKKARDILEQPNVPVVLPRTGPNDEAAPGPKSILLRPGIKHDDRATWSETVNRLVTDGDIDVVPHTLQLKYENWDKNSILVSILPEEVLDEFPENYNCAGHVAHLTLRDQYLPFKHLIGQVFLDKLPGISTVINKVGTLDDEGDNTFRVLKYELLAGVDNLQVEAKEEGCLFRFDYSKVFWNSRLSHERLRLTSKFEPGEMVCDVMAGVGPFALHAARKNVFVWANDLNPYCYPYLEESIALNKVKQFVRPFSTDGHKFIPSSARALLTTKHKVQVPKRISRSTIKAQRLQPADLYTTIVQPKTFNHYIMNLPNSATDFLPDFTGLYAGQEHLFAPATGAKLPMIHCYCFAYGENLRRHVTIDHPVNAELCARVSEKLGATIRPVDDEVEIVPVRTVAPVKVQFCVSFRLPREVAFRRAEGVSRVFRVGEESGQLEAATNS